MMNIKNIKKVILLRNFLEKAVKLCGANMKMFVFALFFILSGYCVFIWYSFVYNPQWSNEKRAEYLKTKKKDVIFNIKKFQDIAEKERQRAEEYNRTLESVNDVFRIK